jgi:hypothetical protein
VTRLYTVFLIVLALAQAALTVVCALNDLSRTRPGAEAKRLSPVGWGLIALALVVAGLTVANGLHQEGQGQDLKQSVGTAITKSDKSRSAAESAASAARSAESAAEEARSLGAYSSAWAR